MNTVAEILQDLELSNFDLEQDNHLATPLSTTQFPLISIVIPVYNGSKYINTAIKSILKQSYSNYEIIVIDDGSTDDTHDQLQPYEDKIRYLYQENEGSASARNLGIKVAKGELIAFLDADDYWSMPEKLEKQVACFANNPAIGCVNTGWRIIDGDNKHIKTVQPWHKAPELNLETWLKRKCVRTSAMIFRREWLEKVGGFDEQLRQSHDVDLILRLSLAGCQTMWLKEETVCYRQHETNTTGNSLKQAKYVQAVLDKFFANQDLPESIREMESQVKYHTLVWLAWYQYRANNLDKMSELLLKSLDITPYLRVENIANWLTSFERFSQERGEKCDVGALTSSLQWQQLVASALGLNNIIKENILGDPGLIKEKQLETLPAINFPQQKTSSTESGLVKLKVFPPKELFLLPSVSNEDITGNLFKFGKHNTPEAYVTAVKGGIAFVSTNSSYVITADRKLVKDVCSNIEPLSSSYHLPVCVLLNEIVAFLALGNTDKNNHLNSIFDLIARIKLLELSGTPLNSIDKFIVDRCHLKFAEPILKSIGINSNKILTSDRYPCIKADLLFVPSFAKKGQKISRWACNFLRKSLTSDTFKSTKNYPRLIYIKCSSSSRIKIVNEQELIEKLLKKIGFTIVDFSSLSQSEQFLYTANAKCIITADRFFLSNIFLCQEGTKIIEIFAKDCLSNSYWLLSNVCSLEHYHLIANKVKDSVNSNNSKAKLNLLKVDLNSLVKIMQKSRLLVSSKPKN